MAVGLTTELEQFLHECEELFKDRYTDQDEEYMEIVKKTLPEPPVVSPWFQRGNRQNESDRSFNRKRKRTFDFMESSHHRYSDY